MATADDTWWSDEPGRAPAVVEWADVDFDYWDDSPVRTDKADDARRSSVPAPAEPTRLTSDVADESPERRRADRLPVALSARVGHRMTERARITDLSEYGILLRGHSAGRPGTELTLSISPEGRTVQLSGEVRWVRLLDRGSEYTFEVGVALSNPPQEWLEYSRALAWDRHSECEGP